MWRRLCRSVGSSRTAFYEWRARFEAGGVKGLLDRSRRPVSTPGAISPSSPAAGHEVELHCAKQLGGSRVRRLAFWPASVVNVSAMSVGSLSGPAIEALNRGASLAGCLQNTREGGVSPYHRNGGELIFQIGTAYFGCRDEHGQFSKDWLRDLVLNVPRPGYRDQTQPGRQTRARWRPARRQGLRGNRCHPEESPKGEDCIEPSRQAEFSDTDSLLDWVELFAAETGLPVGIKSAVGDPMSSADRKPQAE